MGMSTEPPSTGPDGEARLAEWVTDWFSDESTEMSTPEGPSKPCAACGDPHGRNRLLLTVEWEEYLSEAHGVSPPDEECRVPLCTRCRSWAEMLEIAEMNVADYGEEERDQIRCERDRFLDSLRVEIIENFTVSTTLSVYE